MVNEYIANGLSERCVNAERNSVNDVWTKFYSIIILKFVLNLF
jgi:hypothetical protein